MPSWRQGSQIQNQFPGIQLIYASLSGPEFQPNKGIFMAVKGEKEEGGDRT